MDTIRIGGVPEHFNTPWHWEKGKQIFAESGLKINWTEFSGGTGAMNQALRNHELDIALVLTEGAVADIAKGNPSKIIRFFVDTPLVWGIFVPTRSPIQAVESLKSEPFAISRYGSGSHLMLQLLAKERGWNREDLRYQVTQNLQGIRRACQENTATGFLWEKFTTKPLVDVGAFRMVGTLPTPWPCFVMVATNQFLTKHADWLPRLFHAINKSCKTLRAHPQAVDIIAQHATLKPEDVATWLQTMRWTENNEVSVATIQEVADILLDCQTLEKPVAAEKMINR